MTAVAGQTLEVSSSPCSGPSELVGVLSGGVKEGGVEAVVGVDIEDTVGKTMFESEVMTASELGGMTTSSDGSGGVETSDKLIEEDGTKLVESAIDTVVSPFDGVNEITSSSEMALEEGLMSEETVKVSLSIVTVLVDDT